MKTSPYHLKKKMLLLNYSEKKYKGDFSELKDTSCEEIPWDLHVSPLPSARVTDTH